MDRARFEKWLADYLDAWSSYDEKAIAALFSEDAVYHHGPSVEPVRGGAAIVADWTRERDPPGSWRADMRVAAFDGNVGVAEGWIFYLGADGTSVTAEWWDVFVCRFDGTGRCRDFRQWCVRRRARKE